LADSIKGTGVLTAITVRRKKDCENKFQILSGHKRKRAAELAGLAEIPAEIIEVADENQAMLIFAESNIQNSFTDLAISELAAIITLHYRAIQNQGKREDLNLGTSEEILQKSTTARGKIAQIYELNEDQVRQYLCINNLITPLKNRIDKGNIKIAPAVELSFLGEENHYLIDEVLSENNFKITIKSAKKLREFASDKLVINDKLTKNEIKYILSDEKSESKKEEKYNPIKTINITTSIYDKFLDIYKEPDKVGKMIEEALVIYLEKQTPNDTTFINESKMIG
jgi:ParB family chromosome partitioning protein